MINLQLGLYETDVKVMHFMSINDVCEYIKSLEKVDTVWLATDDGEYGEIIVTEKIDTVISALKNRILNPSTTKTKNLFLFDNDTYEDAYSVALSMREENPKCYCL